MAEERLSYTLPPDGTADGRQVDLILTYDPAAANNDGSFTVTDASGTYAILDANSSVVRTDTISGLAPASATAGYAFDNPDNKLFIGQTPYVTGQGISFEIDNVGDSNSQGAVNFSALDADTYREDSANQNYATNVSEDAVTCFLSGTLILTTLGSVAVECLQVGQVVVTSSGALRPIRWLGHRHVDCRRHPRPRETMPVRIAAHAFGKNRPGRDLFLSPGHALCVDVLGEVLIPASALINGSTIVQVDIDSATYWHVELETHEVILAENMPAESYLDMGNRSFFAESGLVALGASPDVSVPTHADFCRPFHAEGVLVSAVRTQLSLRALALGWRLEPSRLEDVHLDVDGVRIDPLVRGLALGFAVPQGARNAWLVSTTNTSAATTDSADQRQLGVRVCGLIVDDGFGAGRSIAVDDSLLCVGFHAVERDGDLAWRWTAGRARLPASLWDSVEGDFFLRIHLASPMLPRWVAPSRALSDDVEARFALSA